MRLNELNANHIGRILRIDDGHEPTGRKPMFVLQGRLRNVSHLGMDRPPPDTVVEIGLIGQEAPLVYRRSSETLCELVDGAG